MDDLTLQKINKLLDYKSFLIEVKKNEILLREGKNIIHNQSPDSPSVEYSLKLKDLFNEIYQKFWTDPHYSREQCEEMLQSSRSIDHAGLDQIRALLTDCVHQEEYSTGYWITLIQNGTMLKILERLDQLKKQD